MSTPLELREPQAPKLNLGFKPRRTSAEKAALLHENQGAPNVVSEGGGRRRWKRVRV